MLRKVIKLEVNYCTSSRYIETTKSERLNILKIKHTKDDKEFYIIIEDLIKNPLVQDLENFTQHGFQSRLEHCVSVSYSSYKLGKKLDLDYIAMARGGLLHDLFFYDWRDTKFEEGTHAYVHPRIAVKNAKKITTLTFVEEDIILNHMMGSTLDVPKTREGFLVSMVDKYLAISEGIRGMFFRLAKNKTPYSHLNEIQPLEVYSSENYG